MTLDQSKQLKSAARYASNEVLRGLMEIIHDCGLLIDPLLDRRFDLDDALMQNLSSQSAKYVSLALLDERKQILDNFGVWFFRIQYQQGPPKATPFPVKGIQEDLETSPEGVPGFGAGFRVYIYVDTRVLAFPEPRVYTQTQGRVVCMRMMGSFGFHPISASVARVQLAR